MMRIEFCFEIQKLIDNKVTCVYKNYLIDNNTNLMFSNELLLDAGDFDIFG